MNADDSPVVRWRTHAREDRPAVFDGDGSHTFAAIDARARRGAAALLGARATLSGERVAILVSPGAPWVEAFLAVLYAGGCALVLSPQHPLPEWTYFVDDAEVRSILVSPDLEERVRPVARDRRVLLTDTLRSAPLPTALPMAAAQDPALQLYTSGTTGKPKGAVLSHGNLAAQQEIIASAWGHRPSDVLALALPLHHIHGLGIALLNMLGAGGAVRLLPAFDATALWEAIGRSTVFMGVPTMYTRLLGAFDAADDATRERWSRGARGLRLSTSGSAALPTTLGERWRAIAGAYPLERFGMTEVGVALSNPLEGPRKPGSVGRPLETVETRIVGDDGNDADSGELWLRGPSVFTGYWKKPDATRAAFADGGWFKTGDTVTRDADGCFKILGRTSVDILKSGGYKLSALEIEEVLREHEAIAEVAVIGLPDEAWGERVVACVIAREGKTCDEAEVRAWAKERLASYKVPKQVISVRELPRNALGKVVKPELAKRLRVGTAD